MNPPLEIQNHQILEKTYIMDCSHDFHRECFAGFRPTCAYRVLACGGA